LFDLFQTEKEELSVPKTNAAPRGVPTISRWKQNEDGSIEGYISGSPLFKKGEFVTTSPIKGEALGGKIVRTNSGSKYFLDGTAAKSSQSVSFSLFGSTKNKKVDNSAEAKRKAEESRAVILAQAKKAAEAKRVQDERKRAEAQGKAAAEARRKETEAKKQEARAAAEARRREVEERRVAALKKAKFERQATAEAKRREAGEKLAAAARIKQAEKIMATAKSSSTTVSLFGLFSQEQNPVVDTNDQSTKKQTVVAPRGLPTISGWKQNRDGSITGSISGSDLFSKGEAVTTSPIKGNAIGGTVVQTGSGSRYFLAPSSATKSKSSVATKTAKEPSLSKIQTSRTFTLFSGKSTAAPRGVPKLVNWKKNRDGSITGFITGSSNFSDGERITTSSISVGDIEEGEVVQTDSGSKYFLA